jgi:hypothetical protein
MIFDALFEKAASVDELDSFVRDNIEKIDSFSNQAYFELEEYRTSIESFIQLKNQILEGLDFTNSYNKAFISVLIEICERLGESSCIVRLSSIFLTKDIYLGERLNAVLLYLYNIQNNNAFVERFDEICEKIEYSAKHEEDNINKPLASFINYYSYVVYNTQPHVQFAERIKAKISEAIVSKKYDFITDKTVSDIIDLSFDDIENHFNNAQKCIDSLLGKIDYDELHFSGKELLIEVNEGYSSSIENAGVSFDTIRRIAVNSTDGQAFTGRGAIILSTEQQLFTYLYRFGNMHKAKLDSAYEFLPTDILNNSIEIIDWGCGQGIASISFFDKQGVNNITSCILIEPSEIAIKRAALHIREYKSDVKLKTICKKLDSLSIEDIPPQRSTRIHLFSNILDIDDYNQSQLCDLISKSISGTNFFLCTSPYIDDRKTDRVDNFKRYFEKEYSEKYTLLGENLNSGRLDDVYWNCNNNHKGVMNVYCSHPECGCRKKWTRVNKVFKVEL